MIVWVHGRAPKPPGDELFELWVEAVRRGLLRDHPSCLAHFERYPKEMIYYGDLSNQFLGQECHDIEHRRALLDSLRAADYAHYPGESAYGIDEPSADIKDYWDRGSHFSRLLRERVESRLQSILRCESVLVLAHSLGAVLTFDALVALGEDHPGLTLLTLGSPLSIPDFLERSPGSPGQLAAWHNVSAQGDRICGPALPRQFKVQEHSVINPMLKEGKPDPHHALGYLSHPKTADLVADWLTSAAMSNLLSCPPRLSSSEPTNRVP